MIMKKNMTNIFFIIIVLLLVSCNNINYDCESIEIPSATYVVILNKSSYTINIIYNSTDCTYHRTLKPSHQICLSNCLKNTIINYEYILGSKHKIFYSNSIELGNKEKYFFTIPEFEFSEEEKESSTIFLTNKTNDEIDIRNHQNVFKTTEGKSSITYGETGIYKIDNNTFLNFKNSTLFYVYATEGNYSFSDFDIQKNTLYFFTISKNGLNLEEKISKDNLLKKSPVR